MSANALTSPDARILAKLLRDMPTDGGEGNLSPWVATVIDKIKPLPIADRNAEWLAILSILPNRDAIAHAIATCDLDAPPAPPGVGTNIEAKMTCLATVDPQDVDWLWHGRVPLGMLTIFAGDPKLGKSFATLALAANVSRGVPMPGDPAPPPGPADVVLMSAEDDLSRTIVPRLISAGADLSRVHAIESIYLQDGNEAIPDLSQDLDKIERAVASLPGCRLIVIDPITAYLGGTDDHRNAELRGVLSPLKQFAEDRNIAIVLVTHLNKSSGANGKHRVSGSIAYVGACRANLLFARDPDDPTGRRVFVCDNGGNLAEPPPTLAYSIQNLGDGPIVAWEADPVPILADDVLAAAANPRAASATEDADECDEWLRGTLAGGPVLAKTIGDWGRAAGFSLAKLNRAKTRIKAASNRTGFGRTSKCHWHLGEWVGPLPDNPDATS